MVVTYGDIISARRRRKWPKVWTNQFPKKQKKKLLNEIRVAIKCFNIRDVLDHLIDTLDSDDSGIWMAFADHIRADCHRVPDNSLHIDVSFGSIRFIICYISIEVPETYSPRK